MKRPPWFWVLAVAVLVAAPALALVYPELAPRGQTSLLAATAALCFAASAVAWTRYRDSRDPHALYLATGLLVLGGQLLAFGVIWPLRHPSPFAPGQGQSRYEPIDAMPIASPFPALAWQIGWLVAAGYFVLGLPWRDRRGRPPARPLVIVGIAALTTVALEALILPVSRSLERTGHWLLPAFGLGTQRFALGAAGWTLAVLTVIALVVTAWRESGRRAPAGTRPIAPWVAAACLLAVIPQLGTLADPAQGLGYLKWADLFQPVVPALVLVGFLVSQRAESSRMRRASDRAAEVMLGRAEIASVIAHDVRGPASTIKGLASTTRKSYDRLGDAERLEFVGMIEQEAERLLSLVNQTALALKVDAGTLAPNLREQELAPLVRQAVADAAVAGHPVDVDAPAGVVASVDTRWFAEAARQCVDNAAKYSPDDVPIRVRLAEDHDGAIVLDIADGGPGIPAEQREAVFEKFARWRPSGYEDRTGSGLGLFICRGIIHEHGGETGIVEAPDGGTILRIRLPRRRVQDR